MTFCKDEKKLQNFASRVDVFRPDLSRHSNFGLLDLPAPVASRTTLFVLLDFEIRDLATVETVQVSREGQT